MAHFRATIRGNRGGASRLGSAKTGIAAAVNGWEVGVSVFGDTRGPDGADRFAVLATSGSGRTHTATLVGYVMLIDGKPEWVPCWKENHAQDTIL